MTGCWQYPRSHALLGNAARTLCVLSQQGAGGYKNMPKNVRTLIRQINLIMQRNKSQ